MPQATSTLRKDIDGLRAVAVLCVLLHHVAPDALPGGFVGVDIFFVISGFLVTRLIDADLEAHRFRYVEFVYKRCRRIIPALVALLVGTLVMGACVLTGPEFVSLARHVGAGSVSASNLLLWHEVGYFDAAATLKPLLHLWSLGIEEQFYLVWPLLLWLLPSQRRVRLLGLTTVVLASLWLSETLAYSDPAQAFYLLHARAWELGAGGLLALAAPLVGETVQRYDARYPAARHVASLSGALLITVTLVAVTSEHTWPGLSALIPVLGTLLMIAAGPTALVNETVLARGIAQWVGQRSYALYLWHWPPLALLHIVAQERGWESDVTLRAAMLLIIPVAVMADVTYRWIEQPVRRRTTLRISQAPVGARHLWPYGLALSCCVTAAAVITMNHGFPARYGTRSGVDANTVLHAAAADSITAYDRFATRCRLADKGTATWCWRIPGEGRGVAVIGDSHAEVVFAGLVAQHARVPLFLTGRKGCAPIVQHEPIPDRTAEICRKAALIAHEAVRSDTSIGTVLLVARGPAYIVGSGFGIDSLRPVVPVTVGLNPHDTLALRTAYDLGLERAVQSYLAAGKRVMLVMGVPEIGFLPTECVIGRPFGLRTVRQPCALSRDAYDRRNAGYRALVRQVALRNPGLEVFDAAPLFCDQVRCDAERGARLLYQDGNHLTLEGSRIVARALAPQLTPTAIVTASR